MDLQDFEISQTAEDFLREILNFVVGQIPESFKVKCISLSGKNNASRNVNPIKVKQYGKTLSTLSLRFTGTCSML